MSLALYIVKLDEDPPHTQWGGGEALNLLGFIIVVDQAKGKYLSHNLGSIKVIKYLPIW